MVLTFFSEMIGAERLSAIGEEIFLRTRSTIAELPAMAVVVATIMR